MLGNRSASRVDSSSIGQCEESRDAVFFAVCLIGFAISLRFAWDFFLFDRGDGFHFGNVKLRRILGKLDSAPHFNQSQVLKALLIPAIRGFGGRIGISAMLFAVEFVPRLPWSQFGSTSR